MRTTATTMCALLLVLAQAASAGATGPGGYADIESLLQTSVGLSRGVTDPVSPVGNAMLAEAAPLAKSVALEASAAIETETVMENGADAKSLFMPRNLRQSVKTIVFFLSMVATVLAYFRFGFTFGKDEATEVMCQCQYLEEIASMEQGEGGTPTRGRNGSERDGKCDSDVDLSVETSTSTSSDSIDGNTDTDGGTDVDTDTEGEIYDGHPVCEGGEAAWLR